MEMRHDGWYKADKGKHFILTELGKKECASYHYKEVGKPVDEYETEAVGWAVEKGYVIEVDDPDWIVCKGYKAVYDHKGYQLQCGNPTVFHHKWMAERAVKEFNTRPWNRDKKGYVIEAVYEGKKPRPCRKYNGKTVYNFDWWWGDIGKEGDYVDQEIADWFLNCVPPRTDTTNMIQCGEPSGSRKEGTTYGTLVRVTDDIWEYKGDCLKGTIDHGTPIPYVG